MSNTLESVDSHPPADWDSGQLKLDASFLQSAGWAKFQAALGNRPHFLSGDGWSCLLIERRAGLGRYLFAAYGPTIDSPDQLDAALSALMSLAKDKNFDWLRLEPISKDLNSQKLMRSLVSNGGRRAPKNVEPDLTRIVDLTPDHDDLLSTLSQTTRNIIRRSYKQNPLRFVTSLSPDDMKLFSGMLKTVASRKGVGFYGPEYYLNQAKVLMPLGVMHLELAFEGKTALGAAVIHDYNGRSSYTYAASLPAARDKNVSALLLWQAMMNAKRRGNRKMDLFGIAPEGAAPSHPWAGFSDFKKKFGGEIVERAGTWDISLTAKYRLYRTGLQVKRLGRR